MEWIRLIGIAIIVVGFILTPIIHPKSKNHPESLP